MKNEIKSIISKLDRMYADNEDMKFDNMILTISYVLDRHICSLESNVNCLNEEIQICKNIYNEVNSWYNYIDS